MKALLLIFMLVTPAAAQQQAPADLQRLISILEQQRNVAWTAHAQAMAQLAQLQEENAKLKAEIEELKKPAK